VHVHVNVHEDLSVRLFGIIFIQYSKRELAQNCFEILLTGIIHKKEHTMDIELAIASRKSIRAFKTDSVPRELLEEIITRAMRAPSWANTQPWEFIIATGDPLKEIERRFLERRGQDPTPDVHRPYEFPEPYLTRIKGLAPKNEEKMGMSEEDYMAFRQERNFKHFDAPVVIYLLIGREFYFQNEGINSWSLYDCGSVIQNIMLLATANGLGTIAQAQSVVFSDILHEVLGVPESKLIALGISIGYPDWDNPANKSMTRRESLDTLSQWVGW
jgi:nitroreductase